MMTSINGRPADWTPEIWAKWHTYIDLADPKFVAQPPKNANYFTPRPYQDEYCRGDKKEGFTFVFGRRVAQVCINGHMSWMVAQ